MTLNTSLSRKFPLFHSFAFSCFSILSSITTNSNLFHYRSIRNKLKSEGSLHPTFLILGSGSSINEVPSSFWEWASQYTTSIGVNCWYHHHFIPNIYSFEMDSKDIIDSPIVLDLLKHFDQEHEKYQNTIFAPKISNLKYRSFIFQNFRNLSQLSEQFVFLRWFKAPHGSDSSYGYFSSLFSRFLIKYLGLLPSCRSHVIFSIYLAYALGARSVIILGVDGYGGYFFKNLNINISKNRPEIFDLIQRGSDPNHGVPTVPFIIKFINRDLIPIFFLGKSMLSKFLTPLYRPYQD